MKSWGRLRQRFHQWRRRRRFRSSSAPLREFVYLDEVSVYSLLASKAGSIASEWTRTQTETLNASLGGDVKAGKGIASAGGSAQVGASASSSTQVVRKAIVQGSFKELHELVDSVTRKWAAPRSDVIVDPESLLERVRAAAYSPFHTDAADLKRGDLLEVEVELEAHKVFRVSTVISTFLDMMKDDAQIFGVSSTEGFSEARAGNRLLEQLMAGLVPVHAKVLRHKVVDTGAKVVICSEEAALRLQRNYNLPVQDLFLVGMAERSLFWKDLRRILFGRSRYTAFCRLESDGLAADWRPVKLADVFRELSPELGSQLDMIGDVAYAAMEQASTRRAAPTVTAADVYNLYATKLANATGHSEGVPLTASLVAQVEDAESTGQSIVGAEIPELRRHFSTLTDLLMVEWQADALSPETLSQLRFETMTELGLGSHGGSHRSESPAPLPGDDETTPSVRYIEAEFVAIYW